MAEPDDRFDAERPRAVVGDEPAADAPAAVPARPRTDPPRADDVETRDDIPVVEPQHGSHSPGEDSAETRVLPAALGDRGAAEDGEAEAATAASRPEPQPEPVPAAVDPAPPARGGNRLAGTAWVLLGALVFQLLYLAVIVLYIVIALGGPQGVRTQLPAFLALPFAWGPVLILFLLFELLVLLLHRAGRLAYVFWSIVIGAAVYLGTMLLVAYLQPNGPTAVPLGQVILQQLFSPPIVIAGLLARETVLWIGQGIGARGKRVRRRDRTAREQYEREVAAAG